MKNIEKYIQKIQTNVIYSFSVHKDKESFIVFLDPKKFTKNYTNMQKLHKVVVQYCKTQHYQKKTGYSNQNLKVH